MAPRRIKKRQKKKLVETSPLGKIKKRRGRPPCVPQSNDVEPSPPKRRGRRSKAAANALIEEVTNDNDVTEDEQEVGRSQGRKQLIDPIPPVEKKMRGRKPKKVSEIADLLPSKRSSARTKRPPVSATGTTLTEEELQERRYDEEMERLNSNCFVEGLLYCDDRGEREVSDNEVESDGEGEQDDSDCEEIDNSSRCPRPGPRKGRGGKQLLKTKKLNCELSSEEIQEMTLLIKGSIRKSLTGNRPGPSSEIMGKIIRGLSPADDDSPRNHTTNSSYIMYRSARHFMDMQNRWFQQHAIAESASAQHTQSMCAFQLKKNGLGKQLYVEHLNWLSTVTMSHRTTSENFQFSLNGVIAWLPEFQQKFLWRYPSLADDARPNCLTEVDLALKFAVVKAETKFIRAYDSLLKTRRAFCSLVELLKSTIYDQRNICVDFEEVHENLNGQSVNFDEGSLWGQKPIRLALEPPYFKTWDGMMAAPMAPDAVVRSRNYSTCFFKRDKQKWTTKDLDQLKATIKEVLHSRRLSVIENRYDSLLSDCFRCYENEMTEEGRFSSSIGPLQNARNRPKKSEFQLTTKYGTINPVICVMDNGIILRSEVTPRLLEEWRTNEEKQLRLKTYEGLVLMENGKIDWDSVSNKMISKSKKNRSPEDCELAWRHEVHPRVNNKRWGKDESECLAGIYERGGVEDWSAVAAELSTSTSSQDKPKRTPYQCFFRIRNKISPPKKIEWNKELDEQLLNGLREHPGNWRIVAASIDDPAATKRQCIERYKKTINPVLRSGPFTRVEDCLLILTIEKLKPFLAREGHFGCLLAYLPWRCETTWRDRANNLFSDWIVPWTLEEDKMLLELAEKMNRNWQQISEQFTSFKNRKGCLTRYKILKERLKDKRFNNSLEAYHEAYAMTRYNVFQYKHLTDVLKLLQRVRDNPLPSEHRNFPGLRRDEKPSEVRLQHMLLTFDTEILNSAIASLTRYIETRNNYWRSWIEKHGKRRRTFDRRTFHPDNPQSVASALHIKGLKLKNKEDIPNLNDFENEIIKFYGRFCRTKALKPNIERRYIPDARTLARWAVVSRLIATPIDEIEDEGVPFKRKWRALQTVSGMEKETKTKQKRYGVVVGGRRKGNLQTEKKHYKKRGPKPKTQDKSLPEKKILKTSKKRGPKSETPDNSLLEKKIQKTSKKRVPKTTMKKLGSTLIQSNPDGYLLIPAEMAMEKIDRKRVSRKQKEEYADPEYVAEPRKIENANISYEMADQLRRSSRTRSYVPQYDNDDKDDDF